MCWSVAGCGLCDRAVSSAMTDSRYNVIIIGGGVVGLGVALEITRRFPRLRLLLLEKEDRVARHQSGHNSGVIHSGVYYKPGSLKARLCVTGAAAMVEFCREHGIAHDVCGKVIVATHEDELPRLEELRRRGEANGLDRPAHDRARGVARDRAARRRTAGAGRALDGNHRLCRGLREICGADFRGRRHGSYFRGCYGHPAHGGRDRRRNFARERSLPIRSSTAPDCSATASAGWRATIPA